MPPKPIGVRLGGCADMGGYTGLNDMPLTVLDAEEASAHGARCLPLQVLVLSAKAKGASITTCLAFFIAIRARNTIEAPSMVEAIYTAELSFATRNAITDICLSFIFQVRPFGAIRADPGRISTHGCRVLAGFAIDAWRVK